MRFVKGAQKHISTFISHSEENNDEARYYETLLQDVGFSAFQYGHGLRPGEHIRSIVFDRIAKCHFFLFLVSDHSLASPWVQRELGLAIALRKERRNYKPIIIPLYAKDAKWRKSRKRPTTFPVRDFETGKKCEPFDLNVRGLDKYASPGADADDVLISLMRPSLLVTRVDDFDDEATFYDSDVFRLYEELFPPEERDDPEDIINWVLRSDLGKERSILLPDRTSLSYTLDSRYFILYLARQAIGLAFFTFDHSSNLIHGNYFAVQECWRGGDIATAFCDEIMSVLAELFPQYEGVVFEVERFDKERIEKIVDHLERTGQFSSEDDRDEIRKFRRVTWYQTIGCLFFLEAGSNEPLICTSPCLDPRAAPDDWAGLEVDYWIMWHTRPGTALDIGAAGSLWARSITAIYLEILGKSLVESSPNVGARYWQYANAVVDRTLKCSQSKEVTLGKFLYRHSALLRRWVRLNIDIPI